MFRSRFQGEQSVVTSSWLIARAATATWQPLGTTVPSEKAKSFIATLVDTAIIEVDIRAFKHTAEHTSISSMKSLRFLDEAIQLLHVINGRLGPAFCSNNRIYFLSQRLDVRRVSSEIEENVGQELERTYQ